VGGFAASASQRGIGLKHLSFCACSRAPRTFLGALRRCRVRLVATVAVIIYCWSRLRVACLWRVGHDFWQVVAIDCSRRRVVHPGDCGLGLAAGAAVQRCATHRRSGTSPGSCARSVPGGVRQSDAHLASTGSDFKIYAPITASSGSIASTQASTSKCRLCCYRAAPPLHQSGLTIFRPCFGRQRLHSGLARGAGRSIQSRPMISATDDQRSRSSQLAPSGPNPAVRKRNWTFWSPRSVVGLPRTLPFMIQARSVDHASRSVFVFGPISAARDLSFHPCQRPLVPRSWRDNFNSWTANGAAVEDVPAPT
jgi:hypothetical protein